MFNLLHRNKISEHKCIEGEWIIDEVILMSLDIEIPLRRDEYHIVEDDLKASCFVFVDNGFFYSGNQMFPKTGSWQTLTAENIRLFTKNISYSLNIENSRLLYTKKIDDLVGYKIYFRKI
jgi:hypothetical protein